ncbi:MAG: cytochrome c biogenesis protein ResB [Alphaproteobacteria bacterium]|nr:cytochrome c biogenesis protein ResB [Alphaproteobacteria bacterium]
MRGLLSPLLDFLSSTRLFFYLLLWLMVLLTTGTVAQKYIGLYQAQKLFFSSAIFWAGGFIPLPGGASVLVLVALGLLIKLAREPWRMHKLGTLTLHAGALLLLVGGFITALFSYEGHLVIPEGGESAFIADYYRVELALSKETGKGLYQDVAVFDESTLREGASLTAPELPFSITVGAFYRNASLSPRPTPLEGNAHGMHKMVALTEAPPAKEAEANLSALLFTLSGAGDDADGDYGVFKDMPVAQHIDTGDGRYLVALRPARTALPFTLRLVRFERTTYPGTDTPRSYHSDVELTDGALHWKSRIEMNAPLRYKGYTFYQSSFIAQDGAVSTVLAVVNNAGRLFPYISSIIMCIGLLIHLAQRLPLLVARGRE